VRSLDDVNESSFSSDDAENARDVDGVSDDRVHIAETPSAFPRSTARVARQCAVRRIVMLLLTTMRD
jgi:hypothetical protein